MNEKNVKKYALCFPGQGSQVVGMGRDLFEAFPVAKSVFQEADDALSFHLTRLMFEGDESELTLTKNAQPAIMTVSIAALRVLTDSMGLVLNPECCAGHSLGEYTALVASNVLSFWDAVRLVNKRGQFMQEAVPEGKGSMAATLGMNPENVKKLCESVAPNGEVQAANFNSPGQIVISGLTEYVEKAISEAKNFGAKRALKLNVSAPFHSKFMKPAADKLKIEFENCSSWADAKFPVIANVSAKPVKNVDEIKTSLYEQTFNPVLWEDSVKYMAEDLSIDNYFELGSGEVIAGLIKRCKKGMNVISAGTPAKLEEILKCLHS